MAVQKRASGTSPRQTWSNPLCPPTHLDAFSAMVRLVSHLKLPVTPSRNCHPITALEFAMFIVRSLIDLMFAAGGWPRPSCFAER